MENIEIEISGHTLNVEIARTDEEHRVGLMNRKSLAENRGMLFVYDRDQRLSFWMKDTLIPLSIAFISSEGIIKEIQNMSPRSLRSIRSQQSVRYALEVNQGFFDELGVASGDQVIFPQGFLDG